MPELKLPKKISIDVAGITKEEWEISQKDLKMIKFLLQEINDFRGGMLDFKNLLAGGVKGFNVKDGEITAGKITIDSLSALSANLGTIIAGLLKSANEKTYFDLDNNVIVIEISADRWIKLGDIGDGKYGVLASKDAVEKFRLEADSGDAYFSGKAVGAVYNE
ncbi:hypothetical protein ES695_04120 [Candidatus Atribacteria bacterium 1244-E10-H5-B2]|nr:MAG: hypothetical protein ES695_04120 [Candidatus Atribacteria bacterium 1244-E10-H5-B2]